MIYGASQCGDDEQEDDSTEDSANPAPHVASSTEGTCLSEGDVISLDTEIRVLMWPYSFSESRHPRMAAAGPQGTFAKCGGCKLVSGGRCAK
jgi:hypothetical protein